MSPTQRAAPSNAGQRALLRGTGVRDALSDVQNRFPEQKCLQRAGTPDRREDQGWRLREGKLANLPVALASIYAGSTSVCMGLFSGNCS